MNSCKRCGRAYDLEDMTNGICVNCYCEEDETKDKEAKMLQSLLKDSNIKEKSENIQLLLILLFGPFGLLYSSIKLFFLSLPFSFFLFLYYAFYPQYFLVVVLVWSMSLLSIGVHSVRSYNSNKINEYNQQVKTTMQVIDFIKQNNK